MLKTNLLSNKEKADIRYVMYSRFVVLFGTYATIVLLVFGVLLAPSILFLYYRNADLSRALEVEKQSQQIINVQNIISDVTSLNQSAEALRTFERTRISLGDFLDSIATIKPAGVVLTTIDFDSTKYTAAIKGTSEKREQFLAFKDGLDKNVFIESVSSPISNIIKESNIQFAVTLTLKKK